MKRNGMLGARVNPAYERAMNDIADETQEKVSYHVRQAVKMYIGTFDDIIDSEITDMIDRELDAYIDARAEQNLVKMVNEQVNIAQRKATTMVYVDDLLASTYYSLQQHDRLDKDEIAERLRDVIEPLKTRAELVDDETAFEKRLENPIKYAEKQIEKGDYNEYNR